MAFTPQIKRINQIPPVQPLPCYECTDNNYVLPGGGIHELNFSNIIIKILKKNAPIKIKNIENATCISAVKNNPK